MMQWLLMQVHVYHVQIGSEPPALVLKMPEYPDGIDAACLDHRHIIVLSKGFPHLFIDTCKIMLYVTLPFCKLSMP